MPAKRRKWPRSTVVHRKTGTQKWRKQFWHSLTSFGVQLVLKHYRPTYNVCLEIKESRYFLFVEHNIVTFCRFFVLVLSSGCFSLLMLTRNIGTPMESLLLLCVCECTSKSGFLRVLITRTICVHYNAVLFSIFTRLCVLLRSMEVENRWYRSFVFRLEFDILVLSDV